MKIDVLYEDADIVAVNKPAGLVVHSDGKTVEPSLSDWVLQKYPQTKNVGEPARTADGREVPRPGIVHRLDRETSGVLLVAKTEKGFDCLKKQFQTHEVKKTYEAFVFGEMPERVSGVKYLDRENAKENAKEIKKENSRGIIDRPIGRSASDFRKWSAQRGARGEMREAVTEFVVKARFGGYSLVEVFPQTGRTHQIRVHFKAVNFPLVADKLYAPDRPNTLGFTRLALHSREVEFQNVAGKKISVVAPYPPDFEKAVAKMKDL
jgi:23S rRNA pseudouridine1911/1915/1917 synthase